MNLHHHAVRKLLRMWYSVVTLVPMPRESGALCGCYTFIIHAKGVSMNMVFVKFYFYIGVRPRIKETFLKTILYDIKMRFHDKSTDAFSQYVKISTL
jgi:hypothetical protein